MCNCSALEFSSYSRDRPGTVFRGMARGLPFVLSVRVQLSPSCDCALLWCLTPLLRQVSTGQECVWRSMPRRVSGPAKRQTSLLLLSHWPGLSHVAIPECEVLGSAISLEGARQNGRENGFGGQPVVSATLVFHGATLTCLHFIVKCVFCSFH